jgi:hypothetical protein
MPVHCWPLKSKHNGPRNAKNWSNPTGAYPQRKHPKLPRNAPVNQLNLHLAGDPTNAWWRDESSPVHGRGVSLDGVRVGVRHRSEAAGVAGAGGGGEERKDRLVMGAAPSSLLPLPPSPAGPRWESCKREESEEVRGWPRGWDGTLMRGPGMLGVKIKMSATHRCHCRGNYLRRQMGPKGSAIPSSTGFNGGMKKVHMHT